eukprot:Clim_evm64s153 gene=Clim_evmTU64s153
MMSDQETVTGDKMQELQQQPQPEQGLDPENVAVLVRLLSDMQSRFEQSTTTIMQRIDTMAQRMVDLEENFRILQAREESQRKALEQIQGGSQNQPPK